MFELEASRSISINSVNFRDEVLRVKNVVLLEFCTSWSGACHIMSPVIKEIMQKHKNDLKFCTIDFEENKDLVSKYNVTKVPTILFFKEGRIIDKVEGVVSKKVMLNKIKILLRNSSFEKIW